MYHVTSSSNAEAEFVKYTLEHPIPVDRGSLVGRTALERRPVHIVDCLDNPEYRMLEAARSGKHRTLLGVPLLRDGEVIGVIGLLRTSVELKLKGRLVVHGGHRPILVIYDRGRIFALDNRCPHMGFPLERGPPSRHSQGEIPDGIDIYNW